jgi:uncharacterized protein
MPVAEPWFYIAAVPAVLIVGISKGGFGGGLALVGVPMMSLLVAPAQAAAIMLPILIVMDAVGVWAYRRRFGRDAMLVMLPGAALGIAASGFAFGFLNAEIMRLLIGLIAVGFVAYNFLGRGRLRPPRSPNAWLGVICGAASGFASTLAYAGGPPAAMYLLPLRLDKTVFVVTTVILFAAINLMKLIPYSVIGQFSTANLATSLVLAPLAPIGVRLGIWLHRRVNEVLFCRLAYAFLAVTGLKLIWDGIAG